MNALQLVLALALQAGAQPADACSALLPRGLVAAVEKAYAGYRVGRAADYSAEDIAANGGAPCPAVATADVRGEGKRAFALFVTSPSPHTILVFAEQRGARWRVSTLMDFGAEGVSSSYVEALEAGSYTDLYASDDAPSEYIQEPGRVASVHSRHAGFIAGTMESSGIAFFFVRGRWVHLWLSD